MGRDRPFGDVHDPALQIGAPCAANCLWARAVPRYGGPARARMFVSSWNMRARIRCFCHAARRSWSSLLCYTWRISVFRWPRLVGADHIQAPFVNRLIFVIAPLYLSQISRMPVRLRRTPTLRRSCITFSVPVHTTLTLGARRLVGIGITIAWLVPLCVAPNPRYVPERRYSRANCASPTPLPSRI
jgi:hypothetical protein